MNNWNQFIILLLNNDKSIQARLRIGLGDDDQDK